MATPVCRAAALAAFSLAEPTAAQDSPSPVESALSPPAILSIAFGCDDPAALLDEVFGRYRADGADPEDREAAAETVARTARGSAWSPLDAASWRALGLDPAAPAWCSLYDFGGFLGLPRYATVAAGVVDRTALDRYLRDEHEEEDEFEVGADGTRKAGNAAWRFSGDRVLIHYGLGTDGLADFVTRLGAAPAVADSRAFRLAVNAAGGAPRLWAWAGPGDEDGGASPFRDTPVHSVSLAVSDRGIGLGIIARESSAVYAALRPGGVSRRFLARLDRPLSAWAASLADPIGALETVTEFVPGMQGGEELDRMMETVGVDRAWVRRQLRDGAFGCVVYEDSDSTQAIVGFARVADVDALKAKLAELIEAGTVPLRAESAGLYVVGGDRFALATTGEFAVFSDHVELVRRIHAGECEGWEPRIGGPEIVAAEVPRQTLARWLDEPAIAARVRSLGDLTMRFDPAPGGVAGRIRLEGGAFDSIPAAIGELAVAAERAQREQARARLAGERAETAARQARVHAAAMAFAARHRRIPSIDDLMAADGDAPPAIAEGDAVDTWFHRFVIRDGDAHGAIVVVSVGPDGELGTEDDLTFGG